MILHMVLQIGSIILQDPFLKFTWMTPPYLYYIITHTLMGGNHFDQNGNFDFSSLTDCLSLELIVVNGKLASTAARMYHKIIASSNQATGSESSALGVSS
jgi:hypothetical protein